MFNTQCCQLCYIWPIVLIKRKPFLPKIWIVLQSIRAMMTLHFWLFFYFRGPYFILYLFQFPTGLPGIPGMPPAGPPRLDLPASLGGSLPPPRGSDPLMSLGPSAPSSGPSAPGLRPPSNNDKVNATDVKGLLMPSPNLLFFTIFTIIRTTNRYLLHN